MSPAMRGGTVALLVALLTLAGCGNKGALRLPDDSPASGAKTEKKTP
jgi:predicted small lipoprotein YifL